MNACGLIWMIIRMNDDVKKVWRRIIQGGGSGWRRESCRCDDVP